MSSVVQPSRSAKTAAADGHDIPLADIVEIRWEQPHFDRADTTATVTSQDLATILRCAANHPLHGLGDDTRGTVYEIRGVAGVLRALSDLDEEGHSNIDLESVLYTLSEQLHHLAARIESASESDEPLAATVRIRRDKTAPGSGDAR